MAWHDLNVKCKEKKSARDAKKCYFKPDNEIFF